MNSKKIPHYEKTKNSNLLLIRDCLRENPSCGKTELAELSGLCFPTVSSAVNTLVKRGEALETLGESGGGRPAAVYRLNPDFQQAVCAILRRNELYVKAYSAVGELIGEYRFPLDGEYSLNMLGENIEQIRSEKCKSLSVAAIGIPGVVNDGVITHLPEFPLIEGENLTAFLTEKLSIKIIAENDINTIVLGEKDKWQNLAHIVLYGDCIGSGLLIDGKLIRGVHGGAGEIEFVAGTDLSENKMLLKSIAALVSVADIGDIAISGPQLTKAEKIQLEQGIADIFPPRQRPILHYIDNDEELYFKGLWEAALETFKTGGIYD